MAVNGVASFGSSNTQGQGHSSKRQNSMLFMMKLRVVAICCVLIALAWMDHATNELNKRLDAWTDDAQQSQRTGGSDSDSSGGEGAEEQSDFPHGIVHVVRTR